MPMRFTPTYCPNCGEKLDAIAPKCEHCGTPNRDPKIVKQYGHHFVLSPLRQVFMFLVGFLGLQIIGFLVELVLELIGIGQYPAGSEMTLADFITKFFKQPWVLLTTNGFTYLIIIGFIFLILRKDVKRLGKEFNNWVPYVAGVAGFAVLFIVDLLWGQASRAIIAANGITPQSNQNQTTIVALVRASPFVSLLIFGLMGPFAEEMTYRVGLFGFASRFGKVAGYIVTALIFGFIHFGWSAIFTPAYPGQLIVELANIPSYIFAGVIFCFLYDRYGFGASLTAHLINNVVSILLSLIP